MTNKIVYQDMDGCLFDFDGGFQKLVNPMFTLDPLSRHDYVEQHLNSYMIPVLKIFETLEPLAGAKRYLHNLMDVCADNGIQVKFLTVVGEVHVTEATAQKRKALSEKLDIFMPEVIGVRQPQHKAIFADMNSWLIDDSLYNIQRFENFSRNICYRMSKTPMEEASEIYAWLNREVLGHEEKD